MMSYLTSFMSTLLVDGEKSVGHDKLNMATFMVLFLLITIEVVVVKVVTFEMEHDDESRFGTHSAAIFFDYED